MAIFDYNVCCYVQTNVVYVDSMRMDDICRMLRNLLVHKKDNSCLFKKQNNKQTPNTMSKATQNPQTEKKEDTPTMTPEMNNSSNKKPNNQSPKKKSAIVRWIVGGFFAMFALVNGFHFSSLFLLCAAFLMFPLPFMETFLQKKNIKAIVAIILSVALFFVGVLTSPPSEPTDPSDDTTQTTPSDNEDNNNSTKPDNSTTKPDNSTTNNNTTTPPDNTTNDDEKVEMVWIPSSGTKYHSKSSCSNMNSPRQIPLDDAKNQGYTACKKCH
jgi:DNA-entry nuclease